MAARRTKEERIAALEAQIQQLREKAAAPKKVKLTKDSAGIAAVISAIENAAEANQVSASEIIKAVSRFKRTGLKIDDPEQKS